MALRAVPAETAETGPKDLPDQISARTRVTAVTVAMVVPEEKAARVATRLKSLSQPTALQLRRAKRLVSRRAQGRPFPLGSQASSSPAHQEEVDQGEQADVVAMAEKAMKITFRVRARTRMPALMAAREPPGQRATTALLLPSR